MVRIELTKTASKQLRKVPRNVLTKLTMWADSIRQIGLKETRKIPGYHDEPLKGNKKNRRSIRLNRQWRAEYFETVDDTGEVIIILEIHPHAY